MKITRKLLTVAATALLSGTFAMTPLAASADSDVDTFAYVGASESMTPMQLVGGSGTFTDTNVGAGVCTSSDTTPPEVYTCSRHESGSYSSIVCGTGSMFGTATVTEPDGEIETMNFSVMYVAGLGIETGGDAAVMLLAVTSTAPAPGCATAFEFVKVGSSF